MTDVVACNWLLAWTTDNGGLVIRAEGLIPRPSGAKPGVLNPTAIPYENTIPRCSAAGFVHCEEVERTIEKYNPSVIVLNCCGATVPFGRLIMNLDDVEKVCHKAPDSVIIVSHLDSVNHALISSGDVKKIAKEKNLTQIRVPANGEKIMINL